MNMLQKLEKYFNETPKEQILKDWESTKEFDKVGITVDDFLKIQSQANGLERSSDKCHIQNVTKRFFSWGDILIGFIAGVFATIIIIAYLL